MREITLSNGGVAIIDDEDYELVAGYEWRLLSSPGKGSYAVASKDGETIWMHRLIAGDPSGLLIDHRDGNGLLNRRSNLRPATRKQNSANRRKNVGCQYKGVRKDRRSKGYHATVRAGGKAKYLGSFPSALAAAKAYDAAASEAFGEFAHLNFGPERDWIIPIPLAEPAWPPRGRRAGDLGRADEETD